MQSLSDRLNALGAQAERVSPAAANRMREHVRLTVETLKTQNRSKIVAAVASMDAAPEITFAEIADIAAKVKSRSEAYISIDELANRRVAEAFGKSTPGLLRDRTANSLIAKARGEFIDPAYKSIFLNPGETLIDGSFDFGDEQIIRAVGSLRRLHVTKENFLASLKRSHPRVHAVLSDIPKRLKYVRFIALLFQPHLPVNLLLNSVAGEMQSTGKRLMATAAWSGFQFYYRYLAAAQEFNTAWDGQRPSSNNRRPAQGRHEIIDETFEGLELIDDLKVTLEAFGHLTDGPDVPIASYA